ICTMSEKPTWSRRLARRRPAVDAGTLRVEPPNLASAYAGITCDYNDLIDCRLLGRVELCWFILNGKHEWLPSNSPDRKIAANQFLKLIKVRRTERPESLCRSCGPRLDPGTWGTNLTVGLFAPVLLN